MRKFLNNILPNENVDLVLRQILLVATLLVVVNFGAINFWPILNVLYFDLLVIVLLFVIRFTQTAFYLMVFLYPFIGAQLVVGNFNAPIVDWLGMLVLFVWFIKAVIIKKENVFSKKYLPVFIFAFIFFVTVLISLLAAENFAYSLKYFLRPILFFYLVFIVLPFNLIKNEQILKKVVRVLLVAGVVVAVLGLLSVFFSSDVQTIARAEPFSFGEFNPIGGNQNAIAEIMVVSWPFALLMLLEKKGYKKQNVFLLLIGLFVVTLLLTFSRSGYISLLLQLLILFSFTFKKKIKPRWFISMALIFMVVPLALYSSVWKNVSWVQSSNYNRLVLSEISWNAFAESPWIGHGPGAFQDIVGNTFVFVVDFGDPLDSHGFVQKILVEHGGLGLLAYVAFLIALMLIFFVAWSQEKNKKEQMQLLSLFIMYIGIIVFELFSTSYYLSRVWIPIGIALAAVAVYKGKKNELV